MPVRRSLHVWALDAANLEGGEDDIPVRAVLPGEDYRLITIIASRRRR